MAAEPLFIILYCSFSCTARPRKPNIYIYRVPVNRFGHKFRLTLWGESHGPEIGLTIDGLPAGLPLAEADFEADLSRRRAGAGGTTARREEDRPEIVAGLYRGHTTGAPLAIRFANADTRPADYAPTAAECHDRPSHADRAAAERFAGWNDPRGGGHFSGRVTVALVAAGVVAKRPLPAEVRFATRIAELGGCSDPARFDALLREAAAAGDSLGAVVECRVAGLPAGLGEPFFDSTESLVAHLLFAIPGIKGVEFGSGFAAARMRGSEHNDPIADAAGRTATNHAGGIAGGLTNGNELAVRVAFKPTASIAREQLTWNRATGRMEPLAVGGRHDTSIALRGAVVAEAAIAIALAELSL